MPQYYNRLHEDLPDIREDLCKRLDETVCALGNDKRELLDTIMKAFAEAMQVECGRVLATGALYSPKEEDDTGGFFIKTGVISDLSSVHHVRYSIVEEVLENIYDLGRYIVGYAFEYASDKKHLYAEEFAMNLVTLGGLAASHFGRDAEICLQPVYEELSKHLSGLNCMNIANINNKKKMLN